MQIKIKVEFRVIHMLIICPHTLIRFAFYECKFCVQCTLYMLFTHTYTQYVQCTQY